MAPPGHPAPSHTRQHRHPVLLAFSVLLAPMLWITLVANVALDEMIVGLLCVAATILFTLYVSRHTAPDLVLRPRDLAQCWRIPRYLLSGNLEIVLVLLKDLLHLQPAANFYGVCGFDSSTHDPVRIARSVLAITYTTAAPNFIVLGIDPAQSRMLFHQISPSSIPRLTQALGARP